MYAVMFSTHTPIASTEVYDVNNRRICFIALTWRKKPVTSARFTVCYYHRRSCIQRSNPVSKS